MHDYLYEHQQALDDKNLEQYAKKTGIEDMAKFKREMKDHFYTARVREDFLSGVRSGVNGTPTFFINGVRFDDSWDEDTLEATLRNAISSSSSRD